MNLRTLDLNLLVILDAVAAEGHVGKAASRLGMTRSAVSHALRRLRLTFNDALFERSPQGMVPTRRATDLIKAVRAGLTEIQAALDEQTGFDSRTTLREFRILLSDHLLPYIVPPVSRRFRADAPRANLIFDHYPHNVSSFPKNNKINSEIESVDLMIMFSDEKEYREYSRKRLFSDDVVVLMRQDHPSAAKEITLNEFLELPMLEISSGFIGETLIDRILEQRGLSYRAAITIPSLSGVVPIIRDTDLCVVLPQRWAIQLCQFGGLSLAALSFVNTRLDVDLVWRTVHERDPGNLWLRRLIEDESRRAPAS